MFLIKSWNFIVTPHRWKTIGHCQNSLQLSESAWLKKNSRYTCSVTEVFSLTSSSGLVFALKNARRAQQFDNSRFSQIVIQFRRAHSNHQRLLVFFIKPTKEFSFKLQSYCVVSYIIINIQLTFWRWLNTLKDFRYACYNQLYSRVVELRGGLHVG